MVISFVCLVPVRLLLSSTGVLYHVNGKMQRAYWLPSYDVFKSPFRDSNEHFRGLRRIWLLWIKKTKKKLFCSSGFLSLLWKQMWTKTILDTNNATLTVRNMFVSSGIWNLWFYLRRLTWITFYWSSCWWWWFLNLNSVIPRTWTISDSRVSCIKPWVLTAQRREFDLNRVPYWVHWMKKRLTAQHERLIPIIWSNICDCNKGSRNIIIAAMSVLIWL